MPQKINSQYAAIRLMPPTREDSLPWLHLNEDPTLKAEIPLLKITSLPQAEKSMERWIAREQDGTPYFLRFIRLAPSGMDGGNAAEKVVGFIASMHYKVRVNIEPEPDLFLSMGLLKPYRHAGIMPVALGLLCGELKNLGFHLVGATVLKGNISSQKCLLKSGFTEVYQGKQCYIYIKSLY